MAGEWDVISVAPVAAPDLSAPAVGQWDVVGVTPIDPGDRVRTKMDALDQSIEAAKSAVKPVRQFGEDIGNALVGGAQKTGVMAHAATWLADDSPEGADALAESIALNAEAAPARPDYATQFDQDLKDAGWRYHNAESVRDYASAVGEGIGTVLTSPRAVLNTVAEQAANAVPAMAGAAGGAAAGSLAGPVGTVVGGATGMVAGEVGTEAGAKVLELIQQTGVDLRNRSAVAAVLKSPGFRQAAAKAGLIKGGVIAAVDLATMGVGHRILSGPARKLEKSAVNVLGRLGVDVSDRAAVQAALATSAVKEALAPDFAAYMASITMGRTAGRAAGVMGVETVGEGIGEGAGQVASGGQTSFEDIVGEMIGSGAQSAVQTAVSGTMAAGNRVAAGPAVSPPTPVVSPSVDDLIGEQVGDGTPNAEGGVTVPAPELPAYMPAPITDANSPAVRGYAEEVPVEDVELAPALPQSEIQNEADILAGQMREPAPAANIDVSGQEVTPVELAPPPVDQLIPNEPPAANIDVQEMDVETDQDRATAARNSRLPPNLQDPRLARAPYRYGLRHMADNLEKGGGVAYKQDENGTITGRTPSLNPEWFQAMQTTPDHQMSVKAVQAAVTKALRGEKLGVREARVVGTMMDVMRDERGEQVDHAREQLAAARTFRKTAAVGITDVERAGELFNEPEYPADWDGPTRALFELADEARAVDRQAADAILESNASDAQVARQLAETINGRRQKGDTQEAQGEREAQAPAEAPGAEEGGARGAEDGAVTPPAARDNIAPAAAPPAQVSGAAKQIEAKTESKKPRTSGGAESVIGTAKSSTSAPNAQETSAESRVQPAARGQQDLLDTSTDTNRQEPPKSAEKSKSSPDAKPDKIEDFGEKLEGARKDYAAKMQDALGIDIAKEPLSKSWPEPDYQKLLDGGASPWTVAWAHAVRDEIPTKPMKAWRLKGWVQQVETLRGMTEKLISGQWSEEFARAKLKETEFAILDKHVGGRAELYEAVGHDKSLKGISVTFGDYGIFEGKHYSPPKRMWSVEKKAKATAYYRWPTIIASGETREEAIASFKAKVGQIEEKTEKNVSFQIYSYRADPGKTVIGKKVGKHYIDLKTFDSVKEARAYLAAHQDELVELLNKSKATPNERRQSNEPRVGIDHRGGVDVTPEMFSEAFGFRGVQFGNYVENDKRQTDLNEAYDALMDLAGVIGVPARALSLNGELGLAFGARGKGGKGAPSAHYEGGKVVINLTKEKGAGALAHEWWHSLDNYFGRQGGNRDGYPSESSAGIMGVREQMMAAFRAVRGAVNNAAIKARANALDARRSKPYWSLGHEMSARAFESYVIAKLQDQSRSNDYLANIVSEDYWAAQEALFHGKDGKETYPYPTAAEIPAIRAAFDEFFRTVETRETDQGVGMFASRADGRWNEVADTPSGPAFFGEEVSLFPLQKMVDGVTNYIIVDGEGNRVGVATLGTADNAVSDIYYIHIYERRRGTGRKVIEALTASSDGPVRIFSILKDARKFWDSVGAYDYDGQQQPNAKVDWEAFSRATQDDGRLAQQDGGEPRPAAGGTDRVRGKNEGSTPQEVRAYLEERVGRQAIKRLLDTGRFHIVTADDTSLPAEARRAIRSGRTISGFTATDGQTYLVADNLGRGRQGRREDAYGIFLHEVGVHFGMREMLGERLLASISTEVLEAAKSGRGKLGRAAAAAVKAVPKSTNPEHVNEEILAWLITDRANHSLKPVKRIIAKILAWLISKGFTKAISPDALVELAKGAAMRAAGGRTTDIMFAQRAEDDSQLEPESARLNRELREGDKSIRERAKRFLRRQLAPGGLLPDSVFAAKIDRDNKIEVVEFDTRNLIAQLESAIKESYGRSARALDVSTTEKLAAIMAGRADPSIPDRVRVRLEAMRQYIDGLSKHYLAALHDDIKAMQAQAVAAGRDTESDAIRAKIDLFETIAGNIGQYVHRSYRAFDDPNWFKAVPDAVVNRARDYLTERHLAKGVDAAEAKRRAEVALHEILKTGTAYDSMEAFIKESKLGAKDLSVLKKREDISPEIRALLGEYVDPRLNFAKSTSKMARLVFNHLFLKKVREVGMGTFLFEEGSRPPAATKQIAGDTSDAYAPLNGMWTFPEVEQAFRDSLGKEQMADWYRVIVQLNGMVKFGKTVLSPTTAARNFQSAMFFAVANGHFNLSHAAKSLDGLKAYFTGRGEDGKIAYLRKLKRLGVVYDTPNAGEMMRLLEDSRMQDWLASGRTAQTVRQGLDYAKKFYSYGDDFWKIIGFENEKAALVKTGMKEADAEVEAAERIRNTYPTYSMVGRAVNWLRRFPLVGTFVSFPAEIIRTSYHIVRYTAADWKSPKRRPMAIRRAAGIAAAAGFAHALQVLSLSMFGYDDDDEEAVRDMAPPWSRNSNLLFLPRDEDGYPHYVDVSFLDPYNYWKRPLTAVFRDEPWQDKFVEVGREVLSPFFGTDILAGAIFEVAANKQGTGKPVFKMNDDPLNQFIDIADHLRKAVQPGLAANLERAFKAGSGDVSSSGKKFTAEDELASWLGWRAATANPRAAMYFRSWEFKDDKSEAMQILREVVTDPNDVDSDDIQDAARTARRRWEKAYTKYGRLVAAARNAGLTDTQIRTVLINSRVSGGDVVALIKGTVPPMKLSLQSQQGAAKKAEVLFDADTRDEIMARYQEAREILRAQ